MRLCLDRKRLRTVHVYIYIKGGVIYGSFNAGVCATAFDARLNR